MSLARLPMTRSRANELKERNYILLKRRLKRPTRVSKKQKQIQEREQDHAKEVDERIMASFQLLSNKETDDVSLSSSLEEISPPYPDYFRKWRQQDPPCPLTWWETLTHDLSDQEAWETFVDLYTRHRTCHWRMPLLLTGEYNNWEEVPVEDCFDMIESLHYLQHRQESLCQERIIQQIRHEWILEDQPFYLQQKQGPLCVMEWSTPTDAQLDTFYQQKRAAQTLSLTPQQETLLERMQPSVIDVNWIRLRTTHPSLLNDPQQGSLSRPEAYPLPTSRQDMQHKLDQRRETKYQLKTYLVTKGFEKQLLVPPVPFPCQLDWSVTFQKKYPSLIHALKRTFAFPLIVMDHDDWFPLVATRMHHAVNPFVQPESFLARLYTLNQLAYLRERFRLKQLDDFPSLIQMVQDMNNKKTGLDAWESFYRMLFESDWKEGIDWCRNNHTIINGHFFLLEGHEPWLKENQPRIWLKQCFYYKGRRFQMLLNVVSNDPVWLPHWLEVMQKEDILDTMDEVFPVPPVLSSPLPLKTIHGWVFKSCLYHMLYPGHIFLLFKRWMTFLSFEQGWSLESIKACDSIPIERYCVPHDMTDPLLFFLSNVRLDGSERDQLFTWFVLHYSLPCSATLVWWILSIRRNWKTWLTLWKQLIPFPLEQDVLRCWKEIQPSFLFHKKNLFPHGNTHSNGLDDTLILSLPCSLQKPILDLLGPQE